MLNIINSTCRRSLEDPSPPRPREIQEVKQLKIFANEKEKLKEKEEEEKEKKIKDRKIVKNETLISHLADCNQIFIDNINGLNISINEILLKTNKEVFEIKELIDLEKEINDNTYS